MNKKKSVLKAFLLLAVLVLPQAVFAIDVPAIAQAYANVVESIVTKIILVVVILIMFVLAGWQMYENGNARPLKWATAASVVMAGAVFFGASMIDYAGQVFNSYTGANSAVSL